MYKKYLSKKSEKKFCGIKIKFYFYISYMNNITSVQTYFFLTKMSC